MDKFIRVGIATTSTDKIEGIKRAFEKIFPNSKIQVFPRKTESGVADQPFGKETSKGAKNRVENLMETLKNDNVTVDYYVSCEAGIDNESIPGEFFSEQVVFICNKATRKGFFGKSSSWSIPKEDIQEIQEADLDMYLRKRGYTGLQDIGNGTYITRCDAVEEGVCAALVSEMNYRKSLELKASLEPQIQNKMLKDLGEERY